MRSLSQILTHCNATGPKSVAVIKKRAIPGVSGDAKGIRTGRRIVSLSLSLSLSLRACSGLTITAQNKQSGSTSPLLYSGSESGTFRIYFGGAEIGQEKFQIVESGSSVKASAETHLT